MEYDFDSEEFKDSSIYKNFININDGKGLLKIEASTANEAYIAWKTRVPLIKIFPADAMGGVEYIENILRQMPFLNLMPTGSVKLSEVVSYLNAGARVVGVGRDFYQGFTPNEITRRTREILTEVKDFTKWNKK